MNKINRIVIAVLLIALVFAVQPRAQQLKSQSLVTYTVTGIDAKTVAATTLFTTDGGARFHPLFIVVEVTAATALTIGGTASIGTNAATYTNVLAALTTGTTVNSMLPNALSALTDSIAPGTAVKFNLTVAATGTSGVLSVVVVGFYA